MSKPLASVTTLALAVACAGTAQAAGFALIENSASGQGRAFAGAAAAAGDVTTLWFNPAGMTRLGKGQLSLAGHGIASEARFRDQGSVLEAGGANLPLRGNDNGGVNALLPNLYYARGVTDRLHLGLGINAPFGLATDYHDGWAGRYHAILSDVKSVNINPALGYRLNDRWSIGAGVSAMYFDAELTKALLTANGDGHSRLSGEDWGWGYNVGLLYQAGDRTRLGLSYRSGVEQDVAGEVQIRIPDVDAGFGGPAEAAVELPASASFSIVHDVRPGLALLADITWSGWSSFHELTAVASRSGTVPTAGGVAVVPAGHVFDSTLHDWKDVWRYAVGLDYRAGERFTLRTGLAYDQEPIRDAARRTPRIPGNDRTWLSAGLGYRLGNGMSLDFGYSHVFFVGETKIDHFVTDAAGNRYTLKGEYGNGVDIVSLQLNWLWE